MYAEDEAGVVSALGSDDASDLLNGMASGPVMIEVRREWDRGKTRIMSATPPKMVLGTMTFGWDQVTLEYRAGYGCLHW